MSSSYHLAVLLGVRNAIKLRVLDESELNEFVNRLGMREVENQATKDLIVSLVTETLVRKGMTSEGSYLMEKHESCIGLVRTFASGRTFLVAVELL